MSRPTTLDELRAAAETEFTRLWAAVAGVPEAARTTPGACEDWSVKDLLAHLHAWHELFLGWEQAGRTGDRPPMPADGYSWKETPALNADIHARTADDPWDDVVARLEASHDQVLAVVSRYGDHLFTKGVERWTGTTSTGAYAVSATSSHYAWATKLIRRLTRQLAAPTDADVEG